jgi:hypothetical protein
MADEKPLEARPPTVDDLVKLCHELNAKGANYIVIGGMAMNQHGFVRATEDIDLLVDATADNLQKVKAALLQLPDQAAQALEPQDLQDYLVIRIADEIVVDLMQEACGVDYAEASADIIRVDLRGVSIPFANLALMWKLKQTVRAKDELDREFLRRKLERTRIAQ